MSIYKEQWLHADRQLNRFRFGARQVNCVEVVETMRLSHPD
ncbi:MAG: hypothetical protein VXZ38_02845 [Planctomycetota bacterium]|nr:hypothetical protein [Planctomycetota bacterium]